MYPRVRTIGDLRKQIIDLPDEMPIVRAFRSKVVYAHFVDGEFSTWCYSTGPNDVRNCCSSPNYPEKDKRIQVLNIS